MLAALAALTALASAPRPASAADLGTAQLLITGTRLRVSPESQTVPLSTPTVVETELEGYDPSGGPLPHWHIDIAHLNLAGRRKGDG